jgi:hypothetical protein
VERREDAIPRDTSHGVSIYLSVPLATLGTRYMLASARLTRRAEPEATMAPLPCHRPSQWGVQPN